VFVTHDIDEAIKLGDRVAVFRVGGKLAQYATPSELLAKPADDFVSSFVGRDRGYRALGFLTATGVPVGPVTTVKVGETASESGWVVVVDENNRPLGWLDLRSTSDTANADDVVSGGSLYEVDGAAGTAGSLRNALDAALSSPAGVGIAVDADGAVAGSVKAEAVLDALATARRTGEVPA
jgi:osmoprotectant transport system ATP-binding protein